MIDHTLKDGFQIRNNRSTQFAKKVELCVFWIPPIRSSYKSAHLATYRKRDTRLNVWLDRARVNLANNNSSWLFLKNIILPNRRWTCSMGKYRAFQAVASSPTENSKTNNMLESAEKSYTSRQYKSTAHSTT